MMYLVSLISPLHTRNLYFRRSPVLFCKCEQKHKNDRGHCCLGPKTTRKRYFPQIYVIENSIQCMTSSKPVDFEKEILEIKSRNTWLSHKHPLLPPPPLPPVSDGPSAEAEGLAGVPMCHQVPSGIL